MSQQDRYEKSLNFFGAITRSLSHELNNVVAIINELNGLMEDFLFAAEQGQSLDPARIKNTVERIGNQVERGKAYIKQLNRFAHSVDNPRTRMDAGEILRLTTDICQRFATLREVSLQCQLQDQGVQIEGSPFDLLQVIFRCIEIALGVSKPGASIMVGLERVDDGISFTLTSQEVGDMNAELSSQLSVASHLVEKAGGRLQSVIETDKPMNLVVYLPSSLRPLSGED